MRERLIAGVAAVKSLLRRALVRASVAASAARARVLAWPLPERIGLAVAAAWLVGCALVVPVRPLGDAGEYFLMAESLTRHLSPEARPADVVALAEKARREGLALNMANMLEVFFPSGDGRRYCYHFWGYSLAIVPAKLLLRAFALPDLKAAQLTNSLLFLYALHQILFAAVFPRDARRILALLALFSPIAWYVLWPHPEAACASAVLLALVWSAQGRHVAATLATSLAAMQNPPLIMLALALWGRAWLTHRPATPQTPRALLRPAFLATLAILPAGLPPLFYLWKLGEISPLARVSTNPHLLSFHRALELFTDLNLGMLPYLPGVLALFVAASLAQLLHVRSALRAIERIGLLLAMALACTITHNWNSGAAGLSRYAVWLLPLVLLGAAEGVSGWLTAGRRARRLALIVSGLVLASQAWLTLARGGLVQGDDSNEHSYAARFVLVRAPALYNPTPHIFVGRTRQQPALPGFAVYPDGGGRCRKAYVRPKDAARLLAACGRLPPGTEAFFARTTPRDRKTYAYVDY